MMFSVCPTFAIAEMPVAAQQLELIHQQPQHQQQVGPEPGGGQSGTTQIYAAPVVTSRDGDGGAVIYLYIQ